MARMHADELEIDEPLVRRLLAQQFPEWADRTLSRVEPGGTVHTIFRLGDDLSLRLRRRDGPTEPGSKELEWLPRLAPLLPLEIPVPVVQGRPSREYP
ncbi:MAG: aminoglycoside phosphotransferase family protein, partial [Gaiellaceae bacterium]